MTLLETLRELDRTMTAGTWNADEIPWHQRISSAEGYHVAEVGNSQLERYGQWVDDAQGIAKLRNALPAIIAALSDRGAAGLEARPLSEWHEDMGDVLWWKFPIDEAPYVGSPNDLGHTVEVTVRAYGVDKLMRVNVGGWPGYHTHWTLIPMPGAALSGSHAAGLEAAAKWCDEKAAEERRYANANSKSVSGREAGLDAQLYERAAAHFRSLIAEPAQAGGKVEDLSYKPIVGPAVDALEARKEGPGADRSFFTRWSEVINAGRTTPDDASPSVRPGEPTAKTMALIEDVEAMARCVGMEFVPDHDKIAAYEAAQQKRAQRASGSDGQRGAPAECDPNCDDPMCPYTHTPSPTPAPLQVNGEREALVRAAASKEYKAAVEAVYTTPESAERDPLALKWDFPYPPDDGREALAERLRDWCYFEPIKQFAPQIITDLEAAAAALRGRTS